MVRSKGKTSNVICLEIDNKSTVLNLKQQYSQKSGLPLHQIALKLKSVNLGDDSKQLSEYGLGENATIHVKNLGPQIGYRTVFIVEYLGPLLIVLLYSYRPAFIYDQPRKSEYTLAAKCGIAAWTFHFFKRELETLFVHRFSRPTMPLFNLFKNCAYYWIFALVVGYPLCSPLYTPPVSTIQVYIGMAIFVVSELANFMVHLQFRHLRPKEGSKLRPIPMVYFISVRPELTMIGNIISICILPKLYL